MIGVDWIAGLQTTAAGFDMIQNHVDLLSVKVHAVPTRWTATATDAEAIIRGMCSRRRQRAPALGTRPQLAPGPRARRPLHRVSQPHHQRHALPPDSADLADRRRVLRAAAVAAAPQEIRTTRRRTTSGCGWRSWRTARGRWQSTTPRPLAAAPPAECRARPAAAAPPPAPPTLVAPAGFRLAAPSGVVTDPAGRCCSTGLCLAP